MQEWPYVEDDDNGTITVVFTTRQSIWFDLDGGTYVGRYGAKQTLTHDAEAGLFVLKSPSGDEWRFHDFDQTLYPTGLVASYQSAGGEETVVQSYNGDFIGEIRRTATIGGETVTESFLYEYFTGGNLQYLTLRRRINSGSWTPIRRVQYEHYGASEAYGSLDDLQRARIQSPDGSAWDDLEVHYYRYYKLGDPNGFEHGLKYVVGPQAWQRLSAITDPLTASNAQLAQFADHYFEYNADRRVTKETLESGSRTFTMAYTTSGHADNYNNWKRKTVETLPDGSQNIVYTNFITQILLKEHVADSDHWIEYHQYDANAHEILVASPSAVVSYNDTAADLDVTLRTDAGLIQLTDYYSSTGSGAAAGYVSATKLQQGTGGTPVTQREFEYDVRTVGGLSVYPVTKETVYRDDAGTEAIETTYAHDWHAGTVQQSQRTTTYPLVPTGQNGTGVAAEREDVFDLNGRRTWSKDERGYITHFVYNVATGALVQQIDDVDTSLASGVPSGWTTPPDGGLNLVTDYQADDLGRTTQVLGPIHPIDLGGTATNIRRAQWTVYDDVNHVTYTAAGFAIPSLSSFTLINPVSITQRDAGGKTLEQIQAVAPDTDGTLAEIIDNAGGGAAAFPQTSYTRWTTYQYTDCCLAASMRVYHTIPSSGAGSSGTNYDQTTYGYDVMKRRNRTVTPGGTITFQVYDTRGQVVSTYIGTNDSGATEQDPTGGGLDPDNNMVLVTAQEYDDGQDEGDGNLTQQTQHVDATTTRVTTFDYDWRNRRTTTDGELDFYQVDTYDNLNHVIQTDRYDTDVEGNLIARGQTQYDNRGRVYQRLRYGVDPATGTVGNHLTDSTWYDPSGHTLCAIPSGSFLFTKTEYDSLGRPTTQSTGYNPEADLSEPLGNGTPDTIADDVLLEQSTTTYDDASNAIQTTQRQRYHNAPDTQLGALGDPSTTPKARVTYAAMYSDAVGRQQATANYGTNGGTALSRPTTIPTASDTILVTSQTYDAAGNLDTTTDPAGMVTKLDYDDAGRRVKVVENFVPISSSSSSSSSSSDSDECGPSDDQNRTTRFTYTPDGQQATLVAENSQTGDQTTTYTYGTTLEESDVATSILLRSVTYPDSVGSSDRVWFTYNRQGQRATVTDQRGCIHEYVYDVLGRLTNDCITTLGSGVDDRVRRLNVAYDVRGLPSLLSSYDNSSVGTGNVLNQVEQRYNDFGQITHSAQQHDGPVTVTSPTVELTYANGSSNTIRATGTVYPDGRVVSYDYGNTGSIDDRTSRIAAIVDEDDTHLADYSYLGLGAAVVVDYTEPEVKYTLVDLTGTNDPNTGDIYSGLDRFGRVKDCRWYNYDSDEDVARLKYDYDPASNRIWRQDVVATSLNTDFDEIYSYDGLHRLKDMQRGRLNGTQTALTTETFAQCWQLDPTGNWHGFKEADTGSSWTLEQSRTANPVNEITAITNTVGSSWAQPAYDPAGNMSTIPQPKDPANSYTAIYDAWNRLVKLVDADTEDVVQENGYDPRTFRIVRKDYVEGVLSATRLFYYHPKWQCLEEQIDTDDGPERQFVWGLRYIDDLIIRDCAALDESSSSSSTSEGISLNERWYALQDTSWSVVAVIDSEALILERYAYSPFGNVRFLTSGMSDRASSAVDNTITFTARERDALTGLMNFRNRWLHTLLGFFSQRDPLQYVDGTSLYRAYFVPMGVDPFGLAIRVCFRQFFSSGPGDHSDMDYATMFDRPVFLLRPRMAHVFIQIEFDDGTVTSYSYHPDEWPIPATFGNGFSTQDMNRQRPARVAINDPGDRNCGDDDYLGRHRCFEVPCEEGSEERLRDYIQAWIEANGAGIEEGDWDQSNPRYPGNWIGTIRHIDPSPNCTAHYWLYGQNCGWWATTMVNDVGLTISPGNLHTMTLWNNGAGITSVGPYSGFYPPRGGRRWCYGRTDIRPPMRGE